MEQTRVETFIRCGWASAWLPCHCGQRMLDNLFSFDRKTFCVSSHHAVWQGMEEGRPVVGVAYVDAASRQMGVAQLDDDEQLCALEAIIVQLGAKEAVVCKVCARGGVCTVWGPS